MELQETGNENIDIEIAVPLGMNQVPHNEE